jgi:alkylation response protein AidB-like acyl-CoA dehydrogenase
MTAYGEVGVDGRAGGTSPRRPIAPAPQRFILTLFYLTAQAGEAGHNCPLACDAGAIRTLQHLGTAEQQAAFLPGLLDPDFDTNLTASQFLTEVQGGSDVGANAVVALPRWWPRVNLVDQRGEVVLLQHRRRCVPAHRACG